MKKFIVFSSMFALVAAGCTTSAPVQNPPAPSQPSVSPAPQLQTYHYAPYNFTFQYPAEFEFTQAAFANLNDKVVQLELPQSAYPNTNFSDADFAVSVGAATTDAQCLNLTPTKAADYTQSANINGVVWHVASTTGVAAGNIYTSKIYRARRQGLCFEIIETVHTGNIANYPAGSVSEVNQAPIWQKLDGILQSFKFEPNSSR